MNVNVKILVENTTPVPPFIGEYGFAALVTVDGKQYLFDTGSADAVFKNAQYLGLDLSKVDDLIISHGHFDHTGGVVPFLQMGNPKHIFAHSGVFTPRYVVAGEFKREIGSLFTAEDVKKFGAALTTVDSFSEIHPNVYLTGAVPRMNDYEDVGGSFKAEINGEMVDDELPDDMSMVIDHPDGLIIISGCAHSGIINIIEHAKKQTQKEKIRAFIGGTHLIMASERRLVKTVEALRSFEIETIIPCHCTGFYSAARLYSELGSKVVKGETAMNFDF
ncbi:MAG: MBL fold metallo-hydrolase [Bacillota bacterium]|nr:MBL fold metallo-hydrolase [Bacillota bacterium]